MAKLGAIAKLIKAKPENREFKRSINRDFGDTIQLMIEDVFIGFNELPSGCIDSNKEMKLRTGLSFRVISRLRP
jgi:hypothetical protein